MKQESETNLEDYQVVGWYHVVEAKDLLRKLEYEGVRFFIESEWLDPAHGNPVAASWGGSFGSSGQVLLHVHKMDMTLFKEVHDPKFLVETPIVDKVRTKPISIPQALFIVAIFLVIADVLSSWLMYD